MGDFLSSKGISMSGRKYSTVELNNNIRQAIRCRLEAEETCARAESLVASLAQAAATTTSLEPLVASAQETLNAARLQLQSTQKTFDQGHIAQLSLSEVQQERRKVQHLAAELRQIDERCRAGTDAAATRASLVGLLDLLEKQRDEIEPWLRDVYSRFQDDSRSLLARTDNEIRRSGTITSLQGEIDQQITQLDEYMEQVSKRRTLDSERHYVAAALEKTCKDMAFEPKFLPQTGPLDDLVLAVNTFAYGVIQFRLQLDGAIHSDSMLSESACFADYTMIEDKLRNLGVITEFRHEDDGQPVRLRRGAKDVPGSGPARVIHGGNRE
jgi:hypothetical protein